MSDESRRELADRMVRDLPRFGRWAFAVRDFETPFGKVGFRQLAILWVLRFRPNPDGEAKPSDFAALLEVKPSVVTRVLAKLALHGFIERRVDPDDGRRFHIQITKSGIDVSKYVEEVFVQELLAGVDHLDDAEIDSLMTHVAMLTEIVGKLEENRRVRGSGMIASIED